VFSKPGILCFLIVNIVNGHHVLLTIYFRLNPISWLKYLAVSNRGDWQLHFLPIKSLNDERIALRPQHFTLDGLNALLGFLAAPHEVGETPFSTGTRVKAKCLRCIGKTEAQHDTAGEDTDDFGKGYHENLLG
jgi:hypothetical protein